MPQPQLSNLEPISWRAPSLDGDGTSPSRGEYRPAASERDSFLDAVKALAITRVVLWHTWAWWWLSWIAAMPAMFFVSGALLAGSLERHGYAATLRSRLTRLLLPFWVYAACAVSVMLAAGWRPDLPQLAAWVLPFNDPVGPRATAGLWIPLWYLRAYLWFLVAAPLLRRAAWSLGRFALFLPTAATVALWLGTRNGAQIPIAITDAAAFSFFVVAGMLYRRDGRPNARVCTGLGLGAVLVSVSWWAQFGPASKIVNASYPLVILTGCAFVALLLAASPLARLTGRPQRVVRLMGSRALSIYLWQGFGLLAADRLVTRQDLTGPVGALASLAVVVVVTAACVWAFGWVEDLAARRRARPPRVHLAPIGAAGMVCLLLAAVLRPAVDAGSTALPPSGQAVVARGERVPSELRKPARPQQDGNSGHGRLNASAAHDPAIRVQAAFDEWVEKHQHTLQSLRSRRVDAAVVDASGAVFNVRWTKSKSTPLPQGVQPWWSMSKVVTTAWLTHLVDEGVVALDDRLSKFLPSVPHAGEITLENLARHQSGIPSEFDHALADANPRDELRDWFDNPRLEFRPGRGFAYSRIGYYLLAWALEEASGTSWEDVVRYFGARAGVKLVIDEDIEPLPEPTHPGTGSYRGHLWSSGGILATADDSARFFHWLMTYGVSPAGRTVMATFANDKDYWFYGLALAPLCPCEAEGRWLRSSRYGLDSLIGSWAFDEKTGATVFVDPDNWFTDDGPHPAFYDLEAALLDAAA